VPQIHEIQLTLLLSVHLDSMEGHPNWSISKIQKQIRTWK